MEKENVIELVRVMIDNEKRIYRGVSYLGSRPTFGGRKVAIAQMVSSMILEVYIHLLDILWAI